MKIARSAQAKLPTEYGEFEIFIYEHDSKEHVALVMGDLKANNESILTRVHSRCLTGDVFSSKRCDCRDQLVVALSRIAKEERGVLIYLDQEGRGIGLTNKVLAYALQDQGLDTVSANVHLGFGPDERDYSVAAAILNDLGAGQIRLMTNNPKKIDALVKQGINISEREPIEIMPNEVNRKYLITKKDKLGHYLSI